MMRLSVLSKIIISTILVCLLTACSLENHKNDSEGGYTISFLDSSFNHEELKWKNNITHQLIDVNNMSDTSLEEKINDSIEDAMTSWISGYILHATAVHLDIYCHSTKYLSFANTLEYTGRRTDYIHDYITIDMKTGKRVMLDEIIRIDEELVKYIQNNDLIKESINDHIYGGDLETLNEYTSEELLNELKECSKTQQEIMEEDDNDIEGYFGPLLTRSSFFLKENQLVIVLGYAGGEHHFTYDVEDISDFLKVEMW